MMLEFSNRDHAARRQPIPSTDLTYLERFLEPDFVAQLNHTLKQLEGAFHVEMIQRATGPIPTPRLVANFSDIEYTVAGSEPARLMPDIMVELCHRVSVVTGHPFNYVLANWYRDGADFTGWHPDKIDFHEPATRIGIVSLGATRIFSVRDTNSRALRAEIPLAEGSLALMSLKLQTYTEHAILPVEGEVAPRISLTLRCIKRPQAAETPRV